MQQTIATLLSESAALKAKAAGDKPLCAAIERAAAQLVKTITSGGTVFSCGNGGSTCDAMHFTEELVARYKRERPGIKAMHLHDPSTLTCWSNDYSFETAFARQVETFCGANDTVVGFSTSGNSANVIAAVEAAKKRGAATIGMLGKDGGKLAKLCDIPLIVPSSATERIQEVHITIVHIFCELIESR
ncbi:MAG: hypothetical protein RL417_1502 [Pseudomonadota bacterium]|jgi:D-sedoheptulose 7-phosphate isomerase